MLRSLSTAASGMDAQQTKLDVTSNNIANVSTPGYKKSRAEFSDLLYQTVKKPGVGTGEGTQAPTGIQIGMGVRTAATQRMHSQGSLQQTGNPLDIAIEGRGFFAIDMPNGDQAYTRDGALKIDSEGRIVNSDGFPLSGGLTIPPDVDGISIAADGTLTVTVGGDNEPVEVGRLELASFANPSGLENMGKNLLKATAASGAAVIGPPGEGGAGSLMQGTLELSNVKIVEEMVDLISGQRAYEVNTRVVRAADEMLAQTANIR